MLNKIDKVIDKYESKVNKKPKEIRVSVNNYRELVKEIYPNTKEKDLLYTPLSYKGINITFGLEFKGDKNE